LDTPVSARICPIKGGTPVIAGRKLAARSKIPNTSSTPRRRKGPRWPVLLSVVVAVRFFVIFVLPLSLGPLKAR
jgi:hypothetical protein